MTSHIQVWQPQALGYQLDPYNSSLIDPRLIPKDGAYVDLGILNMLQEIWRKGVRTLYSCQGQEPLTVGLSENTLEGYLMYSSQYKYDDIVSNTIIKYGYTVSQLKDAGDMGYWKKDTVRIVRWYDPLMESLSG